MAITEIKEIKSIIPYLLKHKNLWVNYDESADVLYLHFTKPNIAEDSEQIDKNTIVRYDAEGHIIGVTILNAGKHVTPFSNKKAVSYKVDKEVVSKAVTEGAVRYGRKTKPIKKVKTANTLKPNLGKR